MTTWYDLFGDVEDEDLRQLRIRHRMLKMRMTLRNLGIRRPRRSPVDPAVLDRLVAKGMAAQGRFQSLGKPKVSTRRSG